MSDKPACTHVNAKVHADNPSLYCPDCGDLWHYDIGALIAERDLLRAQVRRTAEGLGGCVGIEPCHPTNRCGWCAAVELGVL